MEIRWTDSYPYAGRSECNSEGTGDSLQVSFKSRQGACHIAKTIASAVGMTNNWLATQGAMSLKTFGAELAHLRGIGVCGLACTVVWGGWSAMTVLTRFR